MLTKVLILLVLQTFSVDFTVPYPGPDRSGFFGAHIANPIAINPVGNSLPFGVLRIHDSNTGCPKNGGTAWEKVNPADGVFDWTCLDIAMSSSKEIIYTFSRTPVWASSNPTDALCAYGPGRCDPPLDLTKFQVFVNAVIQRYPSNKYWECWNEPNLRRFYNLTVPGNMGKLVTMCSYIRAAIRTYSPSSALNSPAPTSKGDQITGEGKSLIGGPHLFLNEYLSRGGDADVLDAHYYSDPLNPEGSAKMIADQMRDEIVLRNNRPIWNSEFANTPATPEYLSRSFIYLAARDEIEKSIWYGWDYDTRSLWTTTGATASGTAFIQVRNWLTYTAFTDPLNAVTGSRCSCAGSNCPNTPSASQIWTCNTTKGRIVWDRFSTSSYPAGSFTKFSTVDSATPKVITGPNVLIGTKPIYLQ